MSKNEIVQSLSELAQLRESVERLPQAIAKQIEKALFPAVGLQKSNMELAGAVRGAARLVTLRSALSLMSIFVVATALLSSALTYALHAVTTSMPGVVPRPPVTASLATPNITALERNSKILNEFYRTTTATNKQALESIARRLQESDRRSSPP